MSRRTAISVAMLGIELPTTFPVALQASYSLYSESCVGVQAMGVVTLGVGLPSSLTMF
jgi:hypothetical protein